LAVVKADAYGHGLVEMSRMAEDFDLAVATTEEAAELVHANCRGRIWVLEGPFGANCLHLAERHPIVWVLHSRWQVDLLCALPLRTPLHICLKLDSGMHRLGLDPDSVLQVLQQLSGLGDRIVFESVMTHFANSDHPDDCSVLAQMARFDQVIEDCGLRHLPRSLANSGAVLSYPQSWHQWVRPGIILYGAAPDSRSDMPALGLRCVMTLESRIMSLRWIEVGESVGYGSRWRAGARTLIAVVAGGYADGYPRHARDGTPVLVNGQRVPLVGRVSMDMLTLDVTTQADRVQVGDLVELWGPGLAVDEVARNADTIGYQLLTGVSPRVPKVYG
jgi:alanine racemase